MLSAALPYCQWQAEHEPCSRSDGHCCPSMVYVGTSGWAYAAWKGTFYPEDLPASRFLCFYAGQLNAVEVNYTFCGRHVVREPVAERWLAETPETFVFAFRGPKPITHFYRHRLRDAADPVRRFVTTLQPFLIPKRLGPILFQLPESLAADATLLDDFLREWPRELRVSFEFRNASWFTEPVYDVLRRHGAALSMTERDEMQTPNVVTAPFVYLRLRRRRYGRTALRRIAERLECHARRGDVFAFFRQDDPEGPLQAQRVLRASMQRG